MHMPYTKFTVVLVFLLAWADCVRGQSKIRASNTIKAATATIAKAHLSKPIIDREFCKRWIEVYLNSLDPAKLYFLESDVDEFEKYAAELPDFVSNGSTEFVELVSNRFETRAKSALEKAVQRLNLPFDFTIKEQLLFEHEDWPSSELDRTSRWRKQLKYELLVEKLITDAEAERINFLKTQYESILKRVSTLTEQQSPGVYLDSFCKTADPHSGYITQKKFDSFSGGLLKVYSIGLTFRQSKGRAVVDLVHPKFRREPMAGSLTSCELIAIRSQDGTLHCLREMDLHAVDRLAMYGLEADESITLELYDEANMNRFSVVWPRRGISF